MAPSTDQKVSQALANRYQNVEKTKKDVMNLLNMYRGLFPKLERFVFNDGVSKEILNLDGTIPVKYKGNTYNIPICLWLLDNHPVSAPMTYVKPTTDMLIKSSRHVDQNGKVYLPYLHEWNPNTSDLVGLVQIMIMTFSELPPVYAKPKGGAQPAAPSGPAPYPTTPYPSQPGSYMPPTSGSMPYSPPSSGGGYPPYPGYMPATSSSNPPYPPPYQPGVGGGGGGMGPQPSYPLGPASATPYPPPYALPQDGAVEQSGSGQPNASGASTTSTTGTITEEHIRVSLVSAVGDRVRGKLRERYGDALAEVSVLRQQATDLQRGKEKLTSMLAKLNTEQGEVNKSVRVLREREAELRLLVEQSEATEQTLDVDEAVTTTAPLYKQLVQAYAEEQATQDAIYYLGEALRRSVIDLDTYLRHVRAYSRRQYQLRATMTLCRSKANLAG